MQERDTSRDAVIVRTSVVGILFNVLLSAFKAAVGIMTNSIAITLDAVNNLSDAALDSIISVSTLAAAAVYLLWGVSLEAWLGAVISVIIIKSGIVMLRDTISKILGQSTEPQFTRDIKQTVCSFPDVSGAYDLIIYDYGPDTRLASIHIEVPDDYTAARLDELTRKIFDKVYAEHRVVLTGVSVYARNTSDPLTAQAQKAVTAAVLKIEHIKQLHGFYMDRENKNIRFDIVISLDAKDRHTVQQQAIAAAKEVYPEYSFNVAMDTDFSEV